MRYYFTLVYIFISTICFSSHLKGGRIDYEAINGPGLNYRIIITLYSIPDSNSSQTIDTVYFGDGSHGVATRTSFIDYPNSFRVSKFMVNHLYLLNGTYLIHASVPYFIANINNLPHSVSTPVYLESLIVINPFLCPNTSSKLLNVASVIQPYAKDLISSHACYDINWDSLTYQLDSVSNLPVGISLNPVNGEFKWNGSLMTITGNYTFGITTSEWHSGMLRGTVLEKFTITIDSIADTLYNFNTITYPANFTTSLLPGTTFNLPVEFIHPSTIPAVDFYSELFNPLLFTGNYTADTFKGIFSWTPTINDVRTTPYTFIFHGMPGDQDLTYLIYVNGNIVDTMCRPTIGIDELGLNNLFTLFPNPAHDQITITFSEKIGDRIKFNLLDVLGKVIMEFTISDATSIDLSYLRRGIYILKAETAKNTFSKKILLF